MDITIVYDNFAYESELTMNWGFACVVNGLEKTILFDTGTKGNILLENMKKLGIDPKRIDMIVLSHIHDDHTGGLNDFLAENSDVSVVMPKSFPEKFKREVSKSGAENIQIEEHRELLDGVFSTGEMGSKIIEQSLYLETEKGVVLITGCAHPGIIEIVETVKSLSDKPIYLALGGIHLYRKSEADARAIVQTLKELEIQYIAPTHCSGKDARRFCREIFREAYIDSGVGKVIGIE